MIPALLALSVIALILIGFCIFLVHSKDQEVAALNKEHALERGAWASERRELNNRIQAPEIAVLPEAQAIPYVAPDDDEGYWQAQEERQEAVS